MERKEFKRAMSHVRERVADEEDYCCTAIEMVFGSYSPVRTAYEELFKHLEDDSHYGMFGDPQMEENQSKRLNSLRVFEYYVLKSKLYETWEMR